MHLTPGKHSKLKVQHRCGKPTEKFPIAMVFAPLCRLERRRHREISKITHPPPSSSRRESQHLEINIETAKKNYPPEKLLLGFRWKCSLLRARRRSQTVNTNILKQNLMSTIGASWQQESARCQNTRTQEGGLSTHLIASNVDSLRAGVLVRAAPSNVDANDSDRR